MLMVVSELITDPIWQVCEKALNLMDTLFN